MKEEIWKKSGGPASLHCPAGKAGFGAGSFGLVAGPRQHAPQLWLAPRPACPACLSTRAPASAGSRAGSLGLVPASSVAHPGLGRPQGWLPRARGLPPSSRAPASAGSGAGHFGLCPSPPPTRGRQGWPRGRLPRLHKGVGVARDTSSSLSSSSTPHRLLSPLEHLLAPPSHPFH